jgi:phage-related protein
VSSLATFRELMVRIGADVSGFDKAVDNMKKQSQDMSNKFKNNTSNMSQSLKKVTQSTEEMRAKMRAATEEMKAKLKPFQEEVERAELAFYDLSQQMGQFKGSTKDFQNELLKLGQAHKKATDALMANNDAMKTSFITSIGTILAASTQSEKIIGNLQIMDNPLYNLSSGALRVTQGLEKMAKQGTAANLALTFLGPNASMKAYADQIRLINMGLMRYQSLMLGMIFVNALLIAGVTALAFHFNSNLGPALEKLKGVWLEAFRPIGEVFGAFLEWVFKVITKIGELIVAFNKAHPTLAKFIQTFLFLIPILTLILAPLAIGIGLVLGMKAAFALLWAQIAPFVVGLATVLPVAIAVAAVIVGVAAAFYYAYKYITPFREAVNNVIDTIKAFWMAVKGNSGGAAGLLIALGFSPEATKGILSFAQTVRTAIDNIVGAFNFLKGAVLGIVALFQGNMGKGVSILTSLGLSPDQVFMIINIVNTVKTTIINVFTAIWMFIQSIVSQIAIFWQANGQMILQATSTVFNSIWSVILTVMGVIVGLIGFAWPFIQLIIQGTWEAIKNLIHGAVTAILGIIQFFSAILTGNWSAAWDAVKNIVMGILEAVWGYIQLFGIGRVLKFFGAWGKSLGTIFKDMWNGISKTFSEALEKIVQWISSKFNMVQSYIGAVWNTIKGVISSVWNGILSFINGALGSIYNFIVSRFNAASSFISSIFNTIRSIISSAWNAVRSIVSSVISSIYSTIVGGFNSVVSFLSGLGTTFYNAGRGLLDMLIKGIQSMVGKVTSTISRIAQKVRDFLPFSPAKVGPLSDLDHLDFAGPITDAMKYGIPQIEKTMSKMMTLPDMQVGNMTISAQEEGNKNTPIQVVLNYSGNNPEDAYSMVDILEMELGRRIVNSMRFGGVK